MKGNRIFLSKVGWIPFYKNREPEGVPKNVTVSRQGKHWVVSIQVEMVIPEPVHPSTSVVGIDRGVRNFVYCQMGHSMLQ